MKITVLAGGLSPERDVSLSSGALIAASLIRSGHDVALADVYEGISSDCDINELFKKNIPKPYRVTSTEPDLAAIVEKNGGRRELIGPRILELCRAADVVFIALHGAMGENGQLQAVLDVFDINYTGTDYDGSMLAMDKELTKKLIAAEGVPVADGICLDASLLDPERVLREVGLPCVIKPCDCGSSVGVSIVKNEAELSAALALARPLCRRVIAEKLIKGREFSVGILDGEALPAIEIIPKEGFYDYKNKYQGGLTTEVCPADLTADEAARAAETAKKVFSILRLRGYSRIDLIMEEKTGVFYCLEANTLPGMTPTSLLPQEAAAIGIGYDELCERIAKLAIKEREI